MKSSTCHPEWVISDIWNGMGISLYGSTNVDDQYRSMTHISIYSMECILVNFATNAKESITFCRCINVMNFDLNGLPFVPLFDP